MPIISGTLTDGAGQPVTGCSILLRALNTTSAVIVTTTASVGTDAGKYRIEAQPGRYAVTLVITGWPPQTVGNIDVYADSRDGTLNDFLTTMKGEYLQPDALRQFELLAEQAREAAKQALAHADGMVQIRSDAESARDECREFAGEAESGASKALISEKSAGDSALEAAASATAASESAQNAGISESAASDSARSAASSASSAGGAEQRAKASEIAAAQALKDAQEIAKTPGPSAYDIWKSEQPAGADTTLQAYMAFQKGKEGSMIIPAAGDVGSQVLGIAQGAGGFGSEIEGNWIKPAALIGVDPGSTGLFALTEDISLTGTWRALGYFLDFGSQLTLFQRIR
ncbi:hypothetical protein AH845_004708 [Salmonella enterica subsp. enterica]|nr:hypothetical protein [Salmonella enterica subsp. enterica]